MLCLLLILDAHYYNTGIFFVNNTFQPFRLIRRDKGVLSENPGKKRVFRQTCIFTSAVCLILFNWSHVRRSHCKADSSTQFISLFFSFACFFLCSGRPHVAPTKSISLTNYFRFLAMFKQSLSKISEC